MTPGRALDLGNPINWGHPLNAGLVAEWSADPRLPGWASPTIRDLVRARSAHDGALSGTYSWAGGPRPGDGSLVLDGSTASANVTRASALTDNFSFGVYVKGGTGAQQLAYYNGSDAGGWGIGIANDGFVGGLYGSVAWVTSGAAAPGGWYTIIISRVAGTSTVYLNGVATGSTSAATPNAVGAEGVIGNESGQSRYWNGRISQVWVREAALPASQAWGMHEQMVRGNPDRWRWYTPAAWSYGAGGTSPPPPPPTTFIGARFQTVGGSSQTFSGGVR